MKRHMTLSCGFSFLEPFQRILQEEALEQSQETLHVGVGNHEDCVLAKFATLLLVLNPNIQNCIGQLLKVGIHGIVGTV